MTSSNLLYALRCYSLLNNLLLGLLLVLFYLTPAQAQTAAPSKSTQQVAKPAGSKKNIGKMLGADISFLPQLEARGMKFSDRGQEKDAIEILRDHGFNYVRLRLFHNPAAAAATRPTKASAT
jgi:arabinogalactan endo-1,4-beta-galactosidase